MSTMLVNSGSFKVCEEPLHKDIVINGNFNTDISGWGTDQVSIAWDSGYCKATATNANPRLHQSGILTVGKRYRITLIGKSSTTTSPRLHSAFFDDIVSIKQPSYTSEWQSYEFLGTALATTFYLYLGNVAIGGIIDIDNISVSEVQEIPAGVKYVEAVSSSSNIVSFNSDKAYGTWEQELFIDLGSSSPFVSLDFISEQEFGNNYKTGNGYSIVVSHSTNLTLRRNALGSSVNIDTITFTGETRWYKVKITRNLSGLFKVYFDGVLVLTGTDTTYTTSNFYVAHAFGNKYRFRNIKHTVGVEV